ncbi:channel protein VirB10 [Vibrio ichthyoenteri ATCC 700023]|uniref:Channel protein VirB10 n=1 Tax=Vibrio ichthyoenteri ATCC 700023 TaxID=870968 RepID=F9S7T7_9VIBR|nr:type IV secretion system protein VirB10 [Vibrio ichthyoenteri]EGU30987.1 channel protein VirB10 [Vibrio ichthyoenteri ATCC 700023]
MNDDFDGEAVLEASTPNKTPPDKKKVAFFLVGCAIALAVTALLIFGIDGEGEDVATKQSSDRTSTTAQTVSDENKVKRSFEFNDVPKPSTAKEKVEGKKFDTDEPASDKVDLEAIRQQAYLDAKAEFEAAQKSQSKVDTVDGYRGDGASSEIIKTRILDKSSKPQGGGGSGSGQELGITPNLANLPNPFQQSPTQTTSAFGLFDESSEGQGQQGGGALSGMLSGTKSPRAVAAMLYNRDFLLAKGVFIDCVLNTSMDSTVAGMTKCTLTRDVFSDNGTTLLLERGSEVTGEYRANFSQGQSRLFVLWDRIKTPHGVIVNLDSPATDSLGAAGVSGHVETHFWARFGGAMMLSLVDDLAAYAATNGGQSVNNFENSSEAAQTMAAKALEATINIPPTFYKNQGERVGIFIARDIDFSTVYQLRAMQ